MIREPVVSGTFYPGDPRALMRTIDSYLVKVDAPIRAKAVVAPHAGYVYSGAVAAAVFSSVALPPRFIILGPNHTGRGAAMALYPAGQWRTPLGTAPVDEEMNARLLDECRLLREDPAAHAREHSLEVQIPFLQRLAFEFRFSAICVAATEYDGLEQLGHALARAIRSMSEPPLIVASSDMNHYESAEVNRRKDQMAIDQVLAVNPAGLHRAVLENDIGMCGFAPTVAALVCCRDLGATKGELIRYSHSGEVTGDDSEVVSYAGMVVH
ncbi:MAG: AmmeMemoRadiSam system protein B [Acidobacteria bacterium]|nr:AmmeMemoRadiSam system protein B [Acidobacteriota bacterium]